MGIYFHFSKLPPIQSSDIQKSTLKTYNMEKMDLQKLQSYFDEMNEALQKVKTIDELVAIKRKYISDNGIVDNQTKIFVNMSSEDKKKYGPYFNNWKKQMLDTFRKFEKNFTQSITTIQSKIDHTEEISTLRLGNLHPITKTLDRIKKIFSSLGFEIITGPEIEDVYHNFDALNIPYEHPARDVWDTMYITEQYLLRTHTSPMQIREMEKRRPPLRIIVPGKVYRDDTIDASHYPIFHQVEGLCVEEKISFFDLKYVLSIFLQEFFEREIEIRFRPSYFPFTEPSAEVEIECIFCFKKGCSVCKNTGWIEILGAGMVHPKVFEYAYKSGYEKYRGFAFGVGVERLAMLKYRINDIRLFFENRIDFLSQF
jgi:phenylalanyl-tRNA synthetase alpha chain